MPLTPFELLSQFPRHQDRWIGVEVERFISDASGRPFSYEPKVRDVLCELVQAPPTREGKWVIETGTLHKPTGLKKGFDFISLEPGGQFEISPAPQAEVRKLEMRQQNLDREILSLSSFAGLRFLNTAWNSHREWNEVPLLPSRRYELMTKYFSKIPEGRGCEMMRLTCGIHLNFDYKDENEMQELVSLSLKLAPVLISWFSNSRSTRAMSERALIWEKTDALRSELPDFFLSSGLSLSQYANWVESVPLMYAVRETENGVETFDPEGKSFRDLPDSDRPSMALPALRQIFTPVRLKPCCVEIRYLDALSHEDRFSATALLVGLLYSDPIRHELSSLLSTVTADQVRLEMADAARKSWSDSRYELAKRVFDFSRRGLQARGFGEEDFLGPAERYLLTRSCPALNQAASV